MAFKHLEINKIWEDYHEILSKEYFSYYSKGLQEIQSFTDSFKDKIKDLNKQDSHDISELSYFRSFNEDILHLLAESQSSIINYNFKTLSKSPSKLIGEIIKGNPKIIRKTEVFNGYSIQNKANLPLFFKKVSGNILLSSRLKKKKFYNFFRKIFKKELLDLQSYRNRKITYHQMIQNHLLLRMEQEMEGFVEDFMLLKSQVFIEVWGLNEQLNENFIKNLQGEENELAETLLPKDIFTSLSEKISLLEIKLKEELENKLLLVFSEFDEAFEIVDTPDLPTSKFRASIIKEGRTKLSNHLNISFQKWENTHKTLFDDWAMDTEITFLYFSVLGSFSVLHEKISHYINENLSLNLELLREYIEESTKRIEENSTTPKLLKEILQKERKRNSAEFIDKLLAKTINKLSGNINKDIEVFNSQTITLASQISDKRGFVKNKNYERGIKTSEVNWLSPRELLNFEALPHFKNAIEAVEIFVADHLEKSRVKLLALGTVSDFSLESAEMMLQNKKAAIKGSQQVVIEGYGRSLAHLDEASALMEKIKIEPLKDLQLAINNFHSEIQKLKNTDNILELNVKIVKIRAIEKSKKMRQDAVDWVVNFVPKSIAFLKQQFSNTNAFLDEMKKKIGMVQEKPHVSHELSDFLRKTELSLKKLPFVYQRLYQLTPTDEDRFFVQRTAELEKLSTAYVNWQKDRFITTAIIGEKGGGITSLILYFLKKVEPDLPIIHKELSSKIFEPKAYFKFFSNLFEHEEFKSNDEIIDYVNNEADKKIIIIENLQHMYLKVVNGFVCQKMLFDLMTSTSKKVFWLGAYTTHSWEYLEKTLKISSIFNNEIQLEKFNDQTIEEIIFKRNYLSGYKVEFEPSEDNLKSKSYLKLNEQDRKTYLRKTFFKELKIMSNGNVSLAQLYWLRSTNGISNDIIKIKSLKDFDVSFNKDLPANYLFGLHTILAHDGLVIEDYSKVFNSPEYISRNDLIPMLEKGLLMKPKEKYNINPIIFKQVVDLLRSHNFVN